MGVIGGPDPIVQDGLVFTIDPANKRSYVSGGSSAFDMIGNNDGTLSAVTDSNSNAGTWQFTRSNNSYIDLGNSNTLSPLSGDCTWNVWFKKTSTTNTQVVLANWSNNSNYHYLWFGAEGNADQLSIYWNGAKRATLATPNDTWTNLTVTFNDTTNDLKCYVNAGSPITVGSLSYEGAHYNLSLGRDVNRNSYGLDGLIGPVHIYNRVLSAAEVLENYNALKDRFV